MSCGFLIRLFSLSNFLLRGLSLLGIVACYASRVDSIFPKLRETPVKCPVLGMFGATDANIPATVVDELRTILQAAEHPTEVLMFEEVGHGFAHRGGETPQALDARRRMVEFFGKNLA